MLDGRLDQCLWCKIGDNSEESTDVNSLVVVVADGVGQNCNGITESSLYPLSNSWVVGLNFWKCDCWCGLELSSYPRWRHVWLEGKIGFFCIFFFLACEKLSAPSLKSKCSNIMGVVSVQWHWFRCNHDTYLKVDTFYNHNGFSALESLDKSHTPI